MFGYVTFNVKDYILRQIFYEKKSVECLEKKVEKFTSNFISIRLENFLNGSGFIGRTSSFISSCHFVKFAALLYA